MAEKVAVPIVNRISGLAQFVARQSRGLLPFNGSKRFLAEPTLLQQIPIFSELNAEEQMLLLGRMESVSLAAGTPLFVADDRAETLYLVQQGWVRLSNPALTGAEAMVGAGELLEPAPYFLREVYTTTAVAATSLQLYTLSDLTLTNIVTEYPEIGLKIGLAFGRGIAQFRSYLSSVLNRFELLNGLNPFQKYVLARFLTPQQYVERETIYCKDDPPTGFFFVESGSVWLLNDDLTEPLYLTAGNIFGHEATTYGHPHLYTAQAAQDTVVWLLSPADYEKLEHIYPSVKFTFTGNLVNSLAEDFELAVEVLSAEREALQIVCGNYHPLVKNLERVQRTLLWARHHRL